MSPATTPAPQTSALEAPTRSRWSRALWGGTVSVGRAWRDVIFVQVSVVALLYSASQEIPAWARIAFLCAAVVGEVSAFGGLVLAYRHSRRRREWPYDVG